MHPYTADPAQSVSALGELGLLQHIRRWLGASCPPTPQGIGDDCAVLPASLHPALITVDPVIYGEHFDDAVPARAVGAKLLKRNLSDIAAMGGTPRAAVLALALDPRVSVAWLRLFYLGLAATARRYEMPIVGGDIARHRGGLVASLTLLGAATGPRSLTRQGAQLGDALYVTGRLGGSLLGHHHRFTPRLAEGQWLAARPEVTALMDVSDGLAKDLHALVPPGTRPALTAAAIPLSRAAHRRARQDGHSALHHALCDGEDYELLFTVTPATEPQAFAAAWAARFTTPLTCIGHLAAHSARLSPQHLDLTAYHGYEHLR